MSAKVVKRRWFLRPIPILVMVAVIGVTAWFSAGKEGLWASYKLFQTREQQMKQIRQLEARKKQLAEYLAALKAGDEVAMERAARELNLAASNETIYNIQVEPTKR
ncbi:MAG TPA: septum formation initiator family protein [bacterium]|jgi:cell division protein FtsB